LTLPKGVPPEGAAPKERELSWGGKTQRQWADFYRQEFSDSARELKKWESILFQRQSGTRVDEAALKEAHDEIDRLKRRIEVSRTGLSAVRNGHPPPDLEAGH
jgi:hypothetical protein